MFNPTATLPPNATKRNIAMVATTLAALSLLLACGSLQAARTPRQRLNPPVKLRLAYGKKVQYASQIVALKQGYFAEEGLEVEPIAVQAGIQGAEALASGSADVAAMGDAPAIITVASAMPAKIIAEYCDGYHQHRIVAAPRSGIRSAKDLVGKRVGVQAGSSTQGGFLRYLADNGIAIKQVKIVPLDPSDMPEAMLSGQIDVGVGSEPWPSNIEERVKGSYEVAVLPGYYPLVMLASERFAREHPEAVVALLRAVQRASDFMTANPDQAARIVAETTGVPAAKEKKIMRTFGWKVKLDSVTVTSLNRVAEFLYSQQKITRMPAWDKVLDRSFVGQM